MSDSESDIDIEPEGREIYSIEKQRAFWFNISSGHEKWEAYLVYFDEDGDQIEDRAEYWEGGNFSYKGGTIYIKDNQLVNIEDVDGNYDLEENGWELLSMDYICPALVN